ncbi:MAG: DUF1304 family protein [Devosia sp.]|nr:DUF1304 family protein [Devosia sp.]
MVGDILTAAVAAIHVYILILEMFLWTTPHRHRAQFRHPAEASQFGYSSAGIRNRLPR